MCEAPTNGNNTDDIKPNQDIPFGEIFQYSCMTGYETEDSLTTECTGNGTWSCPPPNCTGSVDQVTITLFIVYIVLCILVCLCTNNYKTVKSVPANV